MKYIADDGTEFATEKSCRDYELDANGKYKYWIIHHSADTTETGCTQRKTYIKTIWEGFPAQQGDNEVQILEDYCFENFGKKTAWVQGVAPCVNWRVTKVKKEHWERPEPVNWGGFRTKTDIITLGVGDKNKINVLSQNSL